MKASEGINDLQSIKSLLLSQAKFNRLTRQTAENLLSVATEVLKELESVSAWEREDVEQLAELKQFFQPASVQMLIPEE